VPSGWFSPFGILSVGQSDFRDFRAGTDGPLFSLLAIAKILSQKSRFLIVDLQVFSHFFALKETQAAAEMSSFEDDAT
jgi:hypothetical protein